MRKISILIFFLFFVSTSFAQWIIVPSGNANQLSQIQGAIQGKLGFMLPIADTLNNKSTPYYGALTVLPSDAGTEHPPIYMSNGLWWTTIGNGTNHLDTVYTERPIAVKFDSTGHQVIYLLINGLISGGIVTYDSCWAVGVTAPTYNINYNQFNGLATSVHIDTSSATLNRIDRIVADTFNLVYVIKGTPATIALPPTYNPSFQISLAEVSIPAGTTCLNSGIEIIYDGIADAPAQWDTATAGTITVNFSNTDNPYHLAQALFVSSYTDSSQLIFTDSGQDTVTSSSILKFYLYLNGLFNNQFQIQFFNNDTAVSNNLVVNPYIDVADSNEYQNVSIQLNAFSWSSSIFNKAVFTLRGWDTSGAKGFYLDYIQLQSGINNIIQNNYVDSTNVIAGYLYDYYKGVGVRRNAVSGGSNITLKTNGVTNGSQSILNLKQGSNVTIADDGVGGVTINSSAPGTGTVTNFTAGTLPPLFTTSVANPTTTPALTFILSNAGAYTNFMNNTSSSAAPAFLTNHFADSLRRSSDSVYRRVNGQWIYQFKDSTGSTVTPAALTKTDDTNVTLTLGGTPTTALLQATSLALGWTGQLAVPRGGTGNSTFTAYSVITAGTTSTGAFQNVSGVGTSGQALISNGAAALPTWQDIAVTNAATQKIVATAEQTAFTFSGVPSSYNNFSVFINGGYIDQSPYYTKSGNVITFSSGVQLGAFVTLVFK